MRTRSRAILIGLTLGSLATGASAPLMSVPAHAMSPEATPLEATSPESAVRAPASGSDLVDPPEVSSANGVLETTLTAAPAMVTVAGRSFVSNVYNGLYIPPVLRVRRGDLIRLTLVNAIGPADIQIHGPMSTNLHYHGAHFPPAQPADDVFLEIPSLGPVQSPGQALHHGGGDGAEAGHGQGGMSNRYHYLIRVPADHPMGLHWYHPHVHHQVEKSVLSGMSGVFIVDGLIETQYPQLKDKRERILILKDIQLPGDPENPKTKTINGQLMPVIRMRPGEQQIWRAANVGADAFFDLELEGHEFAVIAHDANAVPRPEMMPDLYLPAGARADTVVTAGRAGRYTLWSRAVATGPLGDPNPKVALATVVVEGPPAQPAPAPSSLRAANWGDVLVNAETLRAAPITRERSIAFTENDQGEGFGLNGKAYDSARNDAVVNLGDVERWTISNPTGERHIFHIHQLDFLVTHQNGKAMDYKGLRDTIDVPEAVNGVPGSVTLIIPFTNPAMVGRFVYHCHILEHEDGGMMANIVVLPNAGQIDPTFGADPTFKAGNPGAAPGPSAPATNLSSLLP